ncbi:hypothetical protein JD844_034132 [Phrynosoma platyrhinos]|uniref:Hydroxysteroid 11-beta-dehydrogenase 1-like protein n=1 Tax=Phrynosoma platyrhinos TaxID=52577 RepID=A0ABQ7T8I2_PHRPL|nr:hypothetical protein JD844_034132 [Phrynosoma platyrhinos]
MWEVSTALYFLISPFQPLPSSRKSMERIQTCEPDFHFNLWILLPAATFPTYFVWKSEGEMRGITLLLSVLAILVLWVAFSWRDTFDPESLSDARVLVTGASDGIGEQMAYHYARFGAQIVLTARREAVLQKVMMKCLELGAKKVFYFPADMASPTEPENLVRFALQHLGGLDYVVNFFSYVSIASAALPALMETKGSLVVVSSLAGRISNPFISAYAATKFALEGFFGSLRHELIMQKKDVSITLCFLGFIDTESAMKITGGKVTNTPAPASEAALAIVKGGATRATEVVYPWTIQLLFLIRDWFPEQRDKIIRGNFIYDPPLD